MLNETISAISQILVFSLIPFIVYLIRTKSAKGFLHYIGLKKSTRKANLLAVLTSLIFVTAGVGLPLISEELREMMFHPESITGKFRAMGFGVESVGILLVIALLKTSFSEEILFRGFIAKRLISWLGFQRGNILQAFIFGAIHVLLFLVLKSNVIFLVFIFFLTSLGAYVAAYLNEKMANGSIIPGWIAHGLGNAISYAVVGFLL